MGPTSGGEGPPAFVDAHGVAWAWMPIEGTFGTFVLADPDAALAQAVATDDDAPYFGTLWPSGRVLAQQIRAGRVPLRGQVGDLGCGVGPAGLAALTMGAAVTFVDAAFRAFPAVHAAAQHLGLAAPQCLRANWDEDMLDHRFDVILAADVLYREGALLPVAQWAARHLREGGSLWTADPGRASAAAFPAVARTAGLHRIEARDAVLDTPSKASVALSRYIR